MTITYFFIFSMATWRVASLLVQEAGPWNIFLKLRGLSGIEHDEDGNIFSVPDNRFFAGILSCVWCCSIWVAFTFVLAWRFFHDFSILIAIPLGFSTGAILINRYLQKAD